MTPTAWFPDRLSTAHAEMAACRRCPIRQGCARVALDDTAHLIGIWAGVYISPPGSAS
ncbi:WhiB family transcriptional regulator [Gordonia sp. NPDC058843]|uniref:WhiB family transcriptional regulator n=1 Tax=Gordonia sp. NPDC058843 TaxID=3346648 RepID=UPI0036845715